MKKFFAILLGLVLALVLVTACDPEDTSDGDKPDADAFTVTVVDENGAPYTGVRVQMCEIGEGAVCYPGVAVDENGKAVYKNDKASKRLVVHIQDHPDYMLYDEVEMNRGEAVTVKMTEHKPLGGNGTGTYDTNGDFTSLNPYIVEEGSYRANVAEADGYVYFAFRTKTADTYTVYSSGETNPKVIELNGSLSAGWTYTGSENGNNDRTSKDKQFMYAFTVGAAQFGDSVSTEAFGGVSGWDGTYAVVLLAVSVEDAASEGKDFCITFVKGDLLA